MFKIAFLALALLSAVLAETTFEAVPGTSTFIAKDGEVMSHPDGYSARADNSLIDGGGNWGDNLWRKRVDGDALIVRNIEINEKKNVTQTYNWAGNFPGKKITHIRFLNMGRQRAYVKTISSNGFSASAVVQIAANMEFRLVIEVYAK